MTTPQPAPITCPMCGRVYEFEQDEDGDWWPSHAEWWSTDEHPFLCRRYCWLKAEGYVYDPAAGQWIRANDSVRTEPSAPSS